MQRTLAKVRGLGFILWQARHMVYHVMLGLLWAWFLRELWGQFNPKWILTSVVGSVFPDVEHISYFLGYGRKDSYTKQIFSYIRHHEWRNLFYFVAHGHKHQTSLAFHNMYTVAIFIGMCVLASLFDWQAGIVLFGAMVSHYLFDMADDMVQLGMLNSNWKRWGRPRK